MIDTGLAWFPVWLRNSMPAWHAAVLAGFGASLVLTRRRLRCA